MELTQMKDVNLMHYVARSALLVYSLQDGDHKSLEADSHGLRSGQDPPSSFVSMHTIRNNQVCEGALITKRKLMKLCQQLMPSLNKTMTYLPENVIGYKPFDTTMLWWLPAGIKHLFFDKSTNIPSGLAPLPPLLFRFNGIGLTVFALKENTRPTPATTLWHSPFWNYGCMGNVSLPQNPTPSDTEKLQNLYFRSAFNFHNPPKLKGTTGDALWKSLVGSGKTEFPLDCLVKAGAVNDLFKRGSNDY